MHTQLVHVCYYRTDLQILNYLILVGGDLTVYLLHLPLVVPLGSGS